MYLKKVCRPPAVGWADFVVGARRICERAQCDRNPIENPIESRSASISCGTVSTEFP